MVDWIDANNLRNAIRNAHGADKKALIYRAHYLSLEERHPLALSTCLALILTGSLLVFLPSVEVFVLVMRKFFFTL